MKKERTAHFVQFWGAPSAVNGRAPLNGVDLAILEFPPRRRRDDWRFATNGMSDLVQQRGVRTELYAALTERQSWALDLLDLLARYPFDNDTYLAEFDTIPIESGQEGDSARAVLLVPPQPRDDETIGAIRTETKEPILVHRVVPITETETKVAISRGGEALWAELLEKGDQMMADRLGRVASFH